MRLRPVAIAALAAAAVTACSSSVGHPHAASSPTNVVDGITIPPPYVAPAVTVVPAPTSCPRAFMAALNAAPTGGRFTQRTQRAPDLLTCSYQNVRPAARHCSKVVVTVNTEPQAFKAFDRWNVETGQNAMWSHDPTLQPVPVLGVGIEADWVPKLHELGAANDTTWVSVVLTFPGGAPSGLPLAEVLATAGLAATG